MIEILTDATAFVAASHANLPHPYGDTSVVLAANEMNTGGLKTWIKENVFGLIFLCAAAAAGGNAIKKDASSVITIVALVVVVLLLVAIAGSVATQQTMGQFGLSLVGL